MSDFDDLNSWENCHSDDLWIFDKLILSKKLGYYCGPSGIEPVSGNYIVRPCINLLGMGRGAEIKKLPGIVPDGFFWCEVFEGRHLSVDYINGHQSLCVEGFSDNPQLFTRWEIVDDKIPFPDINLKGNYSHINIEYINGNIIEIHLRQNPDFIGHNYKIIEPVFNTGSSHRENFILAPDGERVGFLGYHR